MKIEDWTNKYLIEEFTKAALVQGHGSLFISTNAAGEIRRYQRCHKELLRRLDRLDRLDHLQLLVEDKAKIAKNIQPTQEKP